MGVYCICAVLCSFMLMLEFIWLPFLHLVAKERMLLPLQQKLIFPHESPERTNVKAFINCTRFGTKQDLSMLKCIDSSFKCTASLGVATFCAFSSKKRVLL